MAAYDVDERRRQWLVAALASGVFVGGAGWSAASRAGWFGRRPRQLPEGVSFFDRQGRVLVNGEPAEERTVVRAGDRVAVEGDGYAVFAVGNNAYLLRENSALHLDGKDLFVKSMRLLTGAVLGVFGRRRASDPLTLTTTVATIGIRGTGVYAEARPDRTYLCTCYGETQLASRVDPKASETVRTTHHDAARWLLAEPDAGRLIVPAPFVNHTDLELMTLEALVGREVPFEVPANLQREFGGY